jgi:hypothetical protein
MFFLLLPPKKRTPDKIGINAEKSPLLLSTGSGSGSVVELVETTGNSSPDSPLTHRSGSSNTPQFLTLTPRFS